MKPSGYSTMPESIGTSSADLSSTDTTATSINGSLASVLDEIKANFPETKVPDFAKSIAAELSDAYERKSSKSMLPTATLTPTGQEQGRFLVIDIGGSTTKVCVIDVSNGTYEILAKHNWDMGVDDKFIDDYFFVRLCNRVASVLNQGSYFAADAVIPLGLSWSFPLRQTNFHDGYIDIVSKGYTVDPKFQGTVDIAGYIATTMLKTQKIHLQVDSVINDGVSVYVSGLYAHKCKLGIVLGTGINASFSLDHVVRNIELSLYGSNAFCNGITSNVIDLGICPKFAQIPKDNYMQGSTELDVVYQPIEYLCSGRYLGEMFRLGLVYGASTGELFVGQSLQKTKFVLPYEVSSSMVSGLAGTSYDNYEKVFLEAGVQLQPQDWPLVKKLITVLTNRAAIVMVSASLACAMVVTSQEGQECNLDESLRIGYVGSLLKCYTLYRDTVYRLLNAYSPQLNLPAISIHHINDSSILGAAVAAADAIHAD